MALNSHPASHPHRSLRLPEWARLIGCTIVGIGMMSAQAIAQVAEPVTAELRFDRRFENGTAPALPSWITGVDQKGGQFYDDPASWQVSDSVADGTGRLTIHLDRSKLVTDLATTFIFSAEQATDFAVQLFDDQGRVVVIDLFGNLVEVSAAFTTNTFIIPLTRYPTATKLVVRHVHGAVAIYGAVLYPVATEGPMVDAEVKKLARKLGDPLSPENPIVKNLQSIAAAPKPVVSAAQPVVAASSSTASSSTATRPLTKTTTMDCGPGMGTAMACSCGVRRSTNSGPPILQVPPTLPAIKPLKRALAVLVEDTHGGCDIYNEYNFGSAQLARILTAQGAKVDSTQNAKGFDPAKGLTRELLAPYSLLIFNGRFNGKTVPFTDAEVAAVAEWVNAGGGLLVTCASPTASDHLDAYFFNPLIKPYGIQFGWQKIEGHYQAPSGQAAHPIVAELPSFAVYHGISVLSSTPVGDVAHVGKESVMMAKQHGKGRVIAFGAGSAIQNQALNSRIINHSSAQVVASNSTLAMNLALWLSDTGAVQ